MKDHVVATLEGNTFSNPSQVNSILPPASPSSSTFGRLWRSQIGTTSSKVVMSGASDEIVGDIGTIERAYLTGVVDTVAGRETI